MPKFVTEQRLKSGQQSFGVRRAIFQVLVSDLQVADQNFVSRREASQSVQVPANLGQPFCPVHFYHLPHEAAVSILAQNSDPVEDKPMLPQNFLAAF
jgi:hypothetical protein